MKIWIVVRTFMEHSSTNLDINSEVFTSRIDAVDYMSEQFHNQERDDDFYHYLDVEDISDCKESSGTESFPTKLEAEIISADDDYTKMQIFEKEVYEV